MELTLRPIFELFGALDFAVVALCSFLLYRLDIPFDDVTKMSSRERMIERIFFVSSIIILLMLPVFISLSLIDHADSIDFIVSSQLFIFVAIPVAILLYKFRCRAQLLYGMLEIIVGVVAVWLTIISLNQGLLARCMGILAGMYIVVRGLDNVDKDLPNRFRGSWDRMFPKRVR